MFPLTLCPHNLTPVIAERLQLRQGAHHRAVRNDQERHPRGEPNQAVYARPDRTQGAGHDPQPQLLGRQCGQRCKCGRGSP